jgi:hypothetical protein
MPLTLKVTIVLFCFALCGAGTFIASTVREQTRPLQEMNAIPVKNHETAPRVWIMAARL